MVYARVVKLANTGDLSSPALWFEGSSPSSRTISKIPNLIVWDFLFINEKYISYKLTRWDKNVVIGLVSGYNHENQISNPLSIMKKIWQESSEEELSKGGFYISVFLSQGIAVYRHEWGCHKDGEVVINCNGSCNPEFDDIAYLSLKTYIWNNK